VFGFDEYDVERNYTAGAKTETRNARE